MFAVGLRRAVVGLFLAGGLQVALMLPFSAVSHRMWWVLGIAPALLAVLAALGRRAWTAPAVQGADRWLPALCGTALLLSLTASAAVSGTATAASNAAVPLIQLGAFASGLATSRPAWAAALVMVGLHRSGLVLAGTGTLAEHLTSSTWEVSALLASAVGGAGCRILARRVDASAAELARSREADAALRARHRTAHRRARHLHDVALNRLLALSRPGQHDTVELRRQCADAATAIHLGAEVRVCADGSVRDVVDAAAARAGIAVTVRGSSAPWGPAPVLDALAGALDAILVNAARHSGRVHAWIDVVRNAPAASGWSVTVRDDGIGFDPAAVPADRLGLRRSVVDRLADVGGAVDVVSRRGHGTAVTLCWPRPAGAPAPPAVPEAVRRWRALGGLMWTPILLGMGAIAAVNLAVLLGHWGRYRSP